MPDDRSRARIEHVHETATSMPHVRVDGTSDRPVYLVGSKAFVLFRTPRADAVDPATGERYPDVVVFWVESEADKLAMVQDRTSPFFTTPHFDGHPSVLLRASHVAEVSRRELVEVVQGAWLARASRTRAEAWLRAQA